jgi:hypothetical protein
MRGSTGKSTDRSATADTPPGKYECWHFSTPLPGMTFTGKGGGQYVDVKGKIGNLHV